MSIAKNWKLVALFVVVVAAAGKRVPAEGIPSPSPYMAQALGEMMASVRVIADLTDLGYDDGGTCMAGFYLREGESYTLRRPFEAGVRYVLMAGGDEDAVDVDLEILDDDDNRLATDRTTDRMARVYFSPPRSGRYRIRLRLYESVRNAFCSFAVMREGGFDVPMRNLIEAGDEFLQMCDRVAVLTALAGEEAMFPLGTNRGGVWGTVLSGDQSSCIYNLRLHGDTIFLAASDSQSDDIDLFLQTNDYQDIDSDTEYDANPMIRHFGSRSEKYRITVKNVTPGGGPSLVMFGLLQVTPQ